MQIAYFQSICNVITIEISIGIPTIYVSAFNKTQWNYNYNAPQDCYAENNNSLNFTEIFKNCRYRYFGNDKLKQIYRTFHDKMSKFQ